MQREEMTPTIALAGESGNTEPTVKIPKPKESDNEKLYDDEASSGDDTKIENELLAEHFAKDFKIAIKAKVDKWKEQVEIPETELCYEERMFTSFETYRKQENIHQNDISQFKCYYYYIIRNITCTAAGCLRLVKTTAYSSKKIYERHNVCSDCKDKHYKLNWHTNHMLAVLNKMLDEPCNVKCLFLDDGCQAEDVLASRHELFCLYQKTNCLFPDCKWIDSYNELKKHIIKKHAYAIFNKDKRTVMSLQFRVCFGEHDSIFVLMRQYVNKKKFMIGYAIGLVTPENNTNYKFAITVELGKDKKKTISSSCVCVKPYELRYDDFVLKECEKNVITYDNRGDFKLSSQDCTVVSVPFEELIES